MVKYQCYRCEYMTNDKTRMNRHISRKKTCDSLLSNINLDHCKNEILSGMSYKEYWGKINNVKMASNNSILTSNNSISTENNSILTPNNSILTPNNSILGQINENIQSKFKCKYCERSYNRKDNLTKHLKTCKEKKKDDTVRESMTELARLLNEKEEQLKEQMLLVNKELKNREEYEKKLEKKEKEHQKQISELIKKAGIATTNNNNITNNIQNNIKLLNYKDTDISDLTENDYVKCLEHYNFCVPHLIRRIHFNPKKPENHNVYISNLKNSYIMIYMNNKWKVKNRDETISSMIDDKQILFEKKIQEWVKSGNKYPKLMAKFSRYIEKREQNDVINAIKEDIKLMLYNNRNMILENKKLLN